MQIEELRATLRHEPFRVFVIHMVDGRTFPVAHRDYLAISPTERSVIVYDVDGSHSVLDMRLMSELQVPAGNGRSAEPEG